MSLQAQNAPHSPHTHQLQTTTTSHNTNTHNAITQTNNEYQEQQQNNQAVAPVRRETWEEIFQPRERRTQGNRNNNQERQENQDLNQQPATTIQGAKNAAGHHISCEVSNEALRIYYQNVNGIRVDKDMTQWHMALSELHDRNVGVFGMSETCVAWNDKLKYKCKAIARRINTEAAINFANVQNWPRIYQPGGTCIGATGKWRQRVKQIGQDPSGMARWSFVSISGKDTTLTIISAYRVCQKRISGTGPSTAYMQQWNKLRQLGHTNPNPRKAFIEDISRQITEWQEENHSIILMIDANEKWGADGTGIANIAINLRLIDFHSETHGLGAEVPTYHRSAHRIDYVLVSRNVFQNTMKCGIEELNAGIISDHKGLFLDINFTNLMKGENREKPKSEKRKILSSRPKAIQKYKASLQEHLENHTVWQRLSHLIDSQSNNTWTAEERTKLVQIDEEITNGMLSAEAKAGKSKDIPWSVALMQATIKAAYWRLALRGHKTNKNYFPRLEQLAEKAKMSKEERIANSQQEISTKLREANNNVRKVSKEASSNREKFLMEQIDACHQVNQVKKAKILENLLRAKHTSIVFKQLRKMIKGSASGALSYILIPKPFTGFQYDPNTVNEWEAIYDQQRIQELIIGRNIIHFGQAQGTPFTEEPLASLIPPGIKLHDIDIETINNSGISQAAKDIASKLRPCENNIEAKTTLEELKSGYRKWKERTTTSPSRRHLSHYHALLKPDGTPIDECDKKSDDIWKIHLAMFNASVGSGISLPRWWRVENIMIEKIQGTPRLDKLRVIHILEADYNLALKMIWAKRAMSNIEANNMMSNAQCGGRSGRSTLGILISKLMKYDTSARARVLLAMLENDATACYDRMTVNLASAISQSYGVPNEACKSVAETRIHMMYHVRTAAGTSDGFYQHSIETPIHGIGQGAGWSGPVWNFHSDTAIKIMNEKGHGFSFDGPSRKSPRKGTLEGFVDDTHASVNSWFQEISPETLIHRLQQDTQRWADLLHATGGKLNLSKTYYQLYEWSHDEQGNYVPVHCDIPNLRIICPFTKDSVSIKTKTPDDEQETLGVMMAPNQAQKKQIKKLRDKSTMIIRGITSGQATPYAARLAEKQIYIPAMVYSFPVTTIQDATLKSIQNPAVKTFLSLQGFNSNFPRSVVFGPKDLAGMGKLSLPNEQAIAGIFTFIQQTRRRTQAGVALQTNLEWIQQEAGTKSRYLQDTSETITYIYNGLIPHIRRSLQKVQFSIWTEEECKNTRKNDSYIMDTVRGAYTKARIKIINNWRLYLQVEKVSDIATADGTTIHHGWFQRNGVRNSKSTLQWPRQIPPHNKYWSVWTSALRLLTSENRKLRNPLMEWEITQAEHQRKYKYYIDNNTNKIYNISERPTKVHNSTTANRRELLIENPPAEARISNNIQPADIINQDRIKTPSIFNYKNNQDFHKPEWTKHLLGAVSRNINEDTRNQICQASNIKIAGHAMLVNYQWTYAWCIDTETTTVTDNGVAPEHPDPCYITSIAYGFLAAAWFIKTIKQDNLQTCKIQLLMENEDAAKRFRILNWSCPPIKAAFKQGSDVIIGTINTLRPASIEVSHDQAQEGVRSPRCIREANTSVKHPGLAIQRQPNFRPIQPGGPYLQINGKCISRAIKSTIRNKLPEENMKEFLRKKHNWTPAIFNSIDWESHASALKKLNASEHKIIIRFVHHWLPTGAHVHRQSPEHDARCPLCLGASEKHAHFLKCRHEQITTLRDQAIQNIKDLFSDERLRGLEWITSNILLWTRNSQPRNPARQHPHRNIIEQQQQIGWQHLISGRFGKKLRTEIASQKERQGSENPNQAARKIISTMTAIIWYWVTSSWTYRCEAQHGKNDGAQLTPMSRIRDRVSKCYEYKNFLTHNDRKHFQDTLETILNKTKYHQETWLLTAEPIIELHKNNQENTLPGYHDIRSFLQN